MTWSQLPQEIQDLAKSILTQPQLEAFILDLAGDSTYTTAARLGVSRSAVRDRLRNAHAKLSAAGLVQDEDGTFRLVPR